MYLLTEEGQKRHPHWPIKVSNFRMFFFSAWKKSYYVSENDYEFSLLTDKIKLKKMERERKEYSQAREASKRKFSNNDVDSWIGAMNIPDDSDDD